MSFTVQNHAGRPLKNFWNAIHFHPTDAIEDAWGQRILNQVKADKVARTVRMYTMMEDIVSLDASGKLVYDFTENDVRMDYMIEQGFDLLLSYNFIPPCISTDPEAKSTIAKGKTRYKGKFVTNAAIRDYKLWEEICYNYTMHILKRYGLDVVKTWKLQCFNEPDNKQFFMGEEDDQTVRAKEYCKLYDAFEAGVRRASTQLFIGGPALAADLEFFDVFLEHIKTTNKQMDYICFHMYGIGPADLNAGAEIMLENGLKMYRNNMEHIRAFGFEDKPIYINEWGASFGGFCNREDCPKLIFRENEVFSAYYIKLVTTLIQMESPIEKLMICLSGQHEMQTDFSGFRNFFTLNFFRKPIYNAFALAAKLGDCLVSLEEKDDVTVLTTKNDNGDVQVLLCYASETFKTDLADKTITVTTDGFEGIYAATKYMIDKAHSNAFARYNEIVENEAPTAAQMEDVRAAGQIYSEALGNTELAKIEETLSANAVVLYEFKKL